MLAVSGISIVVAVFALLSQGWLSGIAVLILGTIAFALSRVFDLLGDLFASIQSSDESTTPRSEVKNET